MILYKLSEILTGLFIVEKRKTGEHLAAKVVSANYSFTILFLINL